MMGQGNEYEAKKLHLFKQRFNHNTRFNQREAQTVFGIEMTAAWSYILVVICCVSLQTSLWSI